MHEIHGGVGCCRAQRRHEETSTGVGSDVRGLSVNYWQMATECAGVPVPVPVPVSLGLPPRAFGGVASECRRMNVEARRGHHPHATTREDHQSGAGDPAQGMRLLAYSPAASQSVVVWPVQEPIVEMVLSLSGARLKMTVLGLSEHHMYGLATCRAP
jgi:hypothetical protein